jgi:cell division septum initiation protein DivIVA
MPDDHTPDTPDPDEPSQDTPDPTPEPSDLGDAGKRALAAERKRARDEKKRADDLAAKLKEFEDRDKSESQRAAEAAAEAAKRADAAETRALRLEVAHDKGLTPGQAKRLVGATREELEADADEILADFSPKETRDDDERRRPRERLRSGAAPDAEDEPDIDAAVAATRRF